MSIIDKLLGREEDTEMIMVNSPQTIDERPKNTTERMAEAKTFAELVQCVHELPYKPERPVRMILTSATQRIAKEYAAQKNKTLTPEQMRRINDRVWFLLEPVCKKDGILSELNTIELMCKNWFG